MATLSFYKLAILLAAAPYALAIPLTPRAGNPQTDLTLDPKSIMKGLAQDGQSGPDVTAGQVRSLTSKNNFINFCLTQKVPLTDGKQIKTGSCNQTPMGRIVATDKMPSAKFFSPENFSSNTKSFSPFSIKMNIKNLQTGNFVNPTTNYYAAPAQTNDQGVLIGHSHVTIEEIPSFTHPNPLEPTVFAFFKGLNLAADKGSLNVEVDKGLPIGSYRMCSINTAANHQPALVAVAQHGSLDDCTYFKVDPGFTDALGGVKAPNVKTAGGGKFKIDGNDTKFNSAPEAITASCNAQAKACAAKGNADGCNKQKDKCLQQPGSTAQLAKAAKAAGAKAAPPAKTDTKKTDTKKTDTKKPAAKVKEVTVKQGQDCSQIAKAAGVTVAALEKVNPSINAGCTNLAIGQKLKIPARKRSLAGVIGKVVGKVAGAAAKDAKAAASKAAKSGGKAATKAGKSAKKTPKKPAPKKAGKA